MEEDTKKTSEDSSMGKYFGEKMKSDDYFKRYVTMAFCMLSAFVVAMLVTYTFLNLEEIDGFVGHLMGVLSSFIVGAVIAYIICPLVNQMEAVFTKMFARGKYSEKGSSAASALSVVTGILVVIVTVVLLVVIIIPQLVNAVVRLAQIIPENVPVVSEKIREMLQNNEFISKYFGGFFDKAYEWYNGFIRGGFLKYVQGLVPQVSNSVVSVMSAVFNVIIGFIVAIYVLSSRKQLAKQANMIVFGIFKKKRAEAIIREVKYIDKVFKGFINGKIFDAVIVAVIIYVGMVVFRWFNPGKELMGEVLIAVLVGVFNIIPFFGWIIGMVVAAFLLFIVNPSQCVFFIIFNFIIQQVDANYIGPKIYGESTGISSLWVLFALLLFGDLWGIVGMLVGVPIFAVIYHAFKDFIYRGLRRRGMEQLIDDYEKCYPDKEKQEKYEKEKVLVKANRIFKGKQKQ